MQKKIRVKKKKKVERETYEISSDMYDFQQSDKVGGEIGKSHLTMLFPNLQHAKIFLKVFSLHSFVAFIFSI